MSLIATGGIRNGLDVAKAIVLGADAAASAAAMLKSPVQQAEIFERSFRATMFLTGSKNIDELKEVEIWMR